ncbi:MAG: response regulator transcription factor [Deltaproteobacteria bacterium]|nr:response regulator transcription factor [Deltaproteobacteria bacterium]
MIRVLLADDHDIVRAGLRRLVEGAGDMAVVAEAAEGREAIRKARGTAPDVAVVDISMPGLDGLEVIRELRSALPGLPVLVLTMHEEEQFVVRAVGAGAMGYLTKRSAADQLLSAIRKLHAGGRFLGDAAAEALAARVARGADSDSPLDALSNREIQVLRGIALGRSNREIAEAYGISVKTVDTYRLRLLRKLRLRNNAELARFAIQNRIVEP